MIHGAVAFGVCRRVFVDRTIAMERGQPAVTQLPMRASEALAMIDEIYTEASRGVGGALANIDCLARINLIHPSVKDKGEKEIGQISHLVDQMARQKVENRLLFGIDRAARTKMHTGRNGHLAVPHIELQQFVSWDASVNLESVYFRCGYSKVLQ